MRTSILTVAAAALAGAAGLAQAQDTTTDMTADPALGAETAASANLIEVENGALMVDPLGVRAGELEDMDVYASTGDKIGEVEDVLMTPDGQITSVSVEMGGFLGIDEKEVAMPIADLSKQGDDLVADITEEQAETLPVWDD